MSAFSLKDVQLPGAQAAAPLQGTTLFLEYQFSQPSKSVETLAVKCKVNKKDCIWERIGPFSLPKVGQI